MRRSWAACRDRGTGGLAGRKSRCAGPRWGYGQAGQIIIQGFIKKDIPIWFRRLITVVPSLVVIFLGMDPTRTLVLSQVILSFCLPLAIIPLLIFTNDKEIMGDLVNKPITKVAMVLVSTIIIVLDIFLIYSTFAAGG